MPTGEQAPANTPEANNSTVSDKNVSDGAAEVKKIFGIFTSCPNCRMEYDPIRGNQNQRCAAAILRDMGLNISVYASTEAERAAGMENGCITLADGSIRVDLNAGVNGNGVMAYALSHELTHFTEEFSAEKFRTFTDILFAEMESKGVNVQNLIESKKLDAPKGYTGEKLNEWAYSEAVAEMCETMLTDTDALTRISQKLHAKDAQLWTRIKNFLQGLVERLKAAYKGLEPDSDIAKVAKEAITTSEKVLNAYADAVADAAENYRNSEGQKNNAQEGETLNSPRMSAGMTSEERYDKLKDVSIAVNAVTNNSSISEAESKYGTDIRDGVRLKSNDRKKLFQKIAAVFGTTHDYSNKDVELEFTFSGENLKESLHKQGKHYYSFMKMLSCFDDVVDSAIGVETHNRNTEGYKPDNTLQNVYVLIGAFEDGSMIIPVKLEVKEFSNKANSLYVAIALDSVGKGKLGIKKGKIDTEVATVDGELDAAPLPTVRLTDLIAAVNPQDTTFLKYVPALNCQSKCNPTDKEYCI